MSQETGNLQQVVIVLKYNDKSTVHKQICIK